MGEEFTVLTLAGSLSGTASLDIDPAFAGHDIAFVPQWGGNSLVLEAVAQAVPEPSTLGLLGGGVVALLVWRGRRRGGREVAWGEGREGSRGDFRFEMQDAGRWGDAAGGMNVETRNPATVHAGPTSAPTDPASWKE